MKTWEENYLAHYGIKGQKWGVRRFQNPDGSLTEEGKRRYNLVQNASKLYMESAKTSLKTAKGYEKEAKQLRKQPPESPETWLNRNFGSDWKDTEYMKKVWEIDDPIKYGREESRKEHDYHIKSRENLARDERESAKKLEEIAKKWANRDINTLTKAELKKLEKPDLYLW